MTTTPATRSPDEPSWLLVMREAYAGARFADALAVYDARAGAAPPCEAMLLRARIVLKSAPTNAIEFLLEHRRQAVTAEQRYLLELYLGIGFSRLREFTVADSHFGAAEALATTPETIAKTAYHRARRLLLESRIDDAWHGYEATTADRSQRGLVRSETLKGFIFGAAQRYDDQAASLREAISLMARDRKAHLEDRFCAVATLSVLARERVDPESYRIALDETSRPEEWPPDFYVHRFQALRALGWCKALFGDRLGCFRFLREAQNVAEAIPDGETWRTIVLLDRAHFAMLAGEMNWLSDELAAAQNLARRIDWQRSIGEERVALLLFAELLATTEPEKARLFLARFGALDDLRSPLHFFSQDDRLAALADATRGAVFLATGDPAEAEKPLKAAWSTFDRIGYDWRAGKAAIGLARATGKLRWRLLAAEKLEAYPDSWLFHELQALEVQKPAQPSLTATQRRIADLIAAGHSTEAIAEQLGRSPNTVRNHIKLVFKAFGVRSRAALVARLLSKADK